MRLRINTKWHNQSKEVSIEERARTLAFIAWKVAAGLVLDMENEDFQTDSQSMRLDVIKEACAFLLSVTDRLVAGQLTQEERQELITKMALKLVKDMQENSEDLLGKGRDYQSAFVTLLNERMGTYAECSWNDEKGEPGFQYKRVFGDAVAAVMGAKDNKWISQQIIEIEVPMMLANLTKGKAQMVDGHGGESEDMVRELRRANRGED
ncbi:MAG: hypothetical protein QG652_1811 [Pseudomonadota bacterium]|nr:hypothetical protein [Pseudomonadota bacterium]